MNSNESIPSRAWIAGVGLMLALTAVAPVAQAATLQTTRLPCPGFSTNPPGISIGSCDFSAPVANTVFWGQYPTASSSAAFSSTNATAVAEDVHVTWSFNASEVDANVTALHVRRGLDPHAPDTMEAVATLGPDAESYLDHGATTGGDVWYVVEAELANGSIEQSRPFRVSNAQAGT